MEFTFKLNFDTAIPYYILLLLIRLLNDSANCESKPCNIPVTSFEEEHRFNLSSNPEFESISSDDAFDIDIVLRVYFYFITVFSLCYGGAKVLCS